MRTSQQRVVKQHKPDVDMDAAVIDELAQDIAFAQHRIADRFYSSVTTLIGPEIDSAVLRETNFTGFAVRPKEFAGVIAAGYRDRIEAESLKAGGRIGCADLGKIPSVGIDGLIAHRSCSLCRPKSITEPAFFQILHVFKDGAVFSNEDHAQKIADNERRNEDFLPLDVRLKRVDPI